MSFQRLDKSGARKQTDEDFPTVASVWDALPKTIDKPPSPESNDDKPSTLESYDGLRLDSWRAFLEAACVVADTTAERLGDVVQPFDFAAMTGDSVSCLVLEIWFSEILDSKDKPKGGDWIVSDVSRAEYVEPKNGGLVELLSGGEESLHASYEKFIKDWKEWQSAKTF